MKNQDVFSPNRQIETFVLYNCSRKAPDIQGFFPMLRTAFLLCCYKHTLFSRFPHSIYRRQSSSRRGHTRRLFCCPKKRKEKIVIVSSFSTEPKSRYAAQSDYFTVKAEPSRLREKIRPEGKDGCSCLRKAVVKAAPVGCVSRYSKQGLCVPQKSQSQPKSADSLGAQPPIPRKERYIWGKICALPSA